MFDKEFMMEHDEYGTYIRNSARNIPITVNRIDEYVEFISSYVRKHNNMIKKLKAENKDVEHLEYDRDYALYVLGLGEKPKLDWVDKYN